MKSGWLVGLWLACAVATPALATVIQMDCQTGERANSYFQPARIKVKLDTASGIAEIRDDLTAKLNDRPVRGKIENFNDIRLTIIWRLRDLPRDPKLSYPAGVANVLHQRLTVRTGGAGTLVSTTAGQSVHNMREFRADLHCKVLP